MMGRKLIIACVSSLLVVTLLSGCVSSLLGKTGGAGDWTFSLPNNYFVAHINNASIIMGKGSNQQSSGPTIIEPYVMGLCYNSRYVGIRQVPVKAGIAADEISRMIEESTSDDYRYYLIDTKTGDAYGPFSFEEYDSKSTELGIMNLCEWIDTASITRDEGWETYKTNNTTG